MARYEQILNDQKGRLGLHISSRCVCVGIPNYNGLYMLQNAGGARGLQKAGTNEDLSAFL